MEFQKAVCRLRELIFRQTGMSVSCVMLEDIGDACMDAKGFVSRSFQGGGNIVSPFKGQVYFTAAEDKGILFDELYCICAEVFPHLHGFLWRNMVSLQEDHGFSHAEGLGDLCAQLHCFFVRDAFDLFQSAGVTLYHFECVFSKSIHQSACRCFSDALDCARRKVFQDTVFCCGDILFVIFKSKLFSVACMSFPPAR